MVKRIPLTRGKFALVDEADYQWLSEWKWCCLASGYAARSSLKHEGKSRTIFMHKELLGVPVGMQGDHIDCNKLNNTRNNLRICTSAQNAINHKKRKGKYTSKYKGVSKFNKRLWAVYMTSNGIRKNMGYFKSEENAAQAYNFHAVELYGEFANHNMASA